MIPYTTLTCLVLAISAVSIAIVDAFSCIPVPVPPNGFQNYPNNLAHPTTTAGPVASPTTTTTTTTTAPWRIVLDIGREPLSRMPFDWARSGCRMPLVVPCDFVLTSTHSQNNKGDDDGNDGKLSTLVVPRTDTVSFTGQNGAVIRPVQGGTWEFDTNSGVVDAIGNDDGNNADGKPLPTQLSFSLTFPETLQRRDVTIEAGTTLELSGRVFSKAELDALNEAYYEAREHTWQIGGELNEAQKRQGAAKRWNEEKQQWEKRYGNENPVTALQNRWKYWTAKAQMDAKQRQRPDANDLSERGGFPSVDNGLYVAKGGIIRASKNGPVMGTWQAQPITDRPASYRGN